VRKSLQWLVSLTISILAFWLAFRGANVAEVAAALRKANYFYVLPALGCMWIGLLARALSWQSILGRQVPFRRVFAALNEGYLLNNVLPFRLGELGRAYLVSRNQNLSAVHALSSVLVERVIDLCMIVGLFATVLPLVIGLSWAREAAVAALIISGLALGGLFVLTLNRAGVLRLVRWGLKYLSWLNAAHWEIRAGAFLDGMTALQDWRRFLVAAFGSALAWVSASVGAWFLLFAFIPSPTLPMGFFVLIISGLGIALPSAPASVGVFEASVVTALAAFNIEGSVAFSYALMYHALHFGLTGVLGAIALAREGETLTHLAQSARSLIGGQTQVSAPPSVVVEESIK
jgi:glycosyltransferase 2 family protein